MKQRLVGEGRTNVAGEASVQPTFECRVPSGVLGGQDRCLSCAQVAVTRVTSAAGWWVMVGVCDLILGSSREPVSYRAGVIGSYNHMESGCREPQGPNPDR